MAQKWNLQDIVPPDRTRRGGPRRISPAPVADIPQAPSRDMRGAPPVRRMPSMREEMVHAPSTPPVYEEPTVFPETSSYDQTDAVVSRLEITDGRLARMRRYIFAGVAVAIIGFIGFAATVLLSGAEVSVTPKTHSTTVQASFEAKLQPATGELGYELLTLEEKGERQVAANGQENVSEKAVGTIIISNAFSTTPQRLIKNTRFESSTGMIYRISDSVVIPGYKTTNGTVAPGTVTANVIADGAGEPYNLASGRLTIPGLKGSDQYDKMYADIDEKGIAGGFEGTKFIIDETELVTTRQKLHTELRDKLLARIETERPNGFVAFKDAITFTYESLPAENAGDKAAKLKERALLHIPLFNESAFASFIAKSAVPGYKGELVRLESPASMTFKYQGSALEDVSLKESIAFTLSGPVRIIWRFDEIGLKKDLVGTPESSLMTLLSKYPGIDKAKAVVRPIWKNSFPSNPDEIKVIEVLE